MFSLLKIGDFSELNSISIQTLRYYERINLLLPAYVDSETNYRYYHLKQSAKIDLIQFLKQFDFSLAEIKEILEESSDLDLLQTKMEEQQRELLNHQKELVEKIETISSFQSAMMLHKINKDKTTLELLNFPKRYILSYPIAKNIYKMDELEYEFQLREFKQALVKQGFSTSQFNRVGSVMKRVDFMASHFISKELFIFLPRKTAVKGRLTELSGGQYAVLYCHSFKEELVAIKRFKMLIAEQGLTIIGDYICEVIYELPQMNQDQRNMFIRLQVPVAKN